MEETGRDLEALAEEAAGGDEQAFRGLYEALLEPVYRYFYWLLGSPEEAEDLTEEVFARCFTAIGRYDKRKASFRTWFFRIARNVLVDHLRSRGRVRIEALESAGDIPVETAEERWEDEERDRAVREALRELPEAQRQVLVMRYFLGMDNREVEKVLGRSPGAINSLRIRALRRLASELRRKGWL